MGLLASRTSNTLDPRNHPGSASTGLAQKAGRKNRAIGRSRGTLTTKIIPLLDALGNRARFALDATVRSSVGSYDRQS